jgi:hypothetical protein
MPVSKHLVYYICVVIAQQLYIIYGGKARPSSPPPSPHKISAQLSLMLSVRPDTQRHDHRRQANLRPLACLLAMLRRRGRLRRPGRLREDPREGCGAREDIRGHCVVPVRLPIHGMPAARRPIHRSARQP